MNKKIMIALSILILIAINYGIYEKEQTISNGETIFLELRPKDPRSLMQGDYMRLRYKIENEAEKDMEEYAGYKYIVIKPKEDSTAQFIRFHTGQQLAEDEKLLRFYKEKYNHIKIHPNSFFFQEQCAKHFEGAKYGIFKFHKQKKYILIGLADSNFKTISPQECK